MTQPLSWTMIFPVLLQLLQVLLLVLLCLTVLRRQKLLASPIGGMEYASALFSAAVILGVLIIASGSTEYLFRTFKTSRDGDWQGLLFSFCRFFVTALCAVAMFLSMSLYSAVLMSSRQKE